MKLFFAHKRFLVIMLAGLLLMNSCAALAEQVMVMDGAEVYAVAGNTDSRVMTVPAGTRLELIAVKNGWAKVSRSGATAYMKSDDLARIRMWNGKAAYADGVAPMYASISEDSRKLGDIPSGAAVSVVATMDDWAAVSYGEYNGFVRIESLSTSAPKQEDDAEQSAARTAYASVNGAKVYNASGKVLGTVGLNTEVTVTAVRGSLCRVVRGGYTAYMYQSQLSYERVAEPDDGVTYIEPATFYAAVSNAKVYNTSGKVIGSIPLNTAVTVSAYTDTLAKVHRDGHTAVMYRADLSETPSEEKADDGVTYIAPTTFYVKNDGAKVYNASGKAINTLPRNYELTVDAYTDSLARISSGSHSGFMYRSDLSAEKLETSDGVTEIEPATFYVKTEGAEVRDSDKNLLGTLSVNTVVTVTAYTDDLAKVTNGSIVGFMRKSDLSAEKVETADDVTEITPTTFYVKTEGAEVRDSDKNLLGTLSVNTAVTVTAYTDDLAKVTNGSIVGFMRKSDLSAEKVETSYELKYGDKGEAVEKVQTRLKELGYFSGSIGGNYLDITRSAVAAFQAAAKLDVTGVCDEKTLKAMFSDDAPKKPSSDSGSGSGSSATGESTVAAATGTAVEMDWWTSGIQSIFARGTVANITDVSTGIAWREKRTGGTNHADVQPLTAADTAAMKKAVGSWSWNRRAIFVTINGVNYAASMNCMPHGSGSITNNNFDGHHCIHFTNSRTHGSNKVCSLHQAAIRKAAKASL